MNVLYQVPLVIQSQLCLSISYSKCWFLLIIHKIPTWCNIVLNTNEVIIYLYVVFIVSIDIIFFPQLPHLIAIFSTLFWSQFTLLYQQQIWITEKYLTMTVTVLSHSLSCLQYNPWYPIKTTNWYPRLCLLGSNQGYHNGQFLSSLMIALHIG